MSIRNFVLVAGVTMLTVAVLAPAPAGAASDIDWHTKRDAARAHAAAITQAWGRLASWITRRPRGSDPDLTQVRGPHRWLSGPASRGIRSGETFGVVTQGAPPAVRPIWHPGWTVRGLDFRFCNNVLAVYADEPLKGADMPTIAVEGGLQIVRGSIAKGTPQRGYPTTAIPGCMTLPNGAVALVSTAIDPFDWASTRRRNEHDDWQRGCPMPGGDPAATVGHVRYAQTRPIESHPWARHPAGTTGYPVGCVVGTDPGCRDIGGRPVDMDRWPDLCRDRPAAGGTFTYAGPVYGTVTGVLPEHGACVPNGSGIVGTHIAAAVEHDGCRPPTLIGGRRSARWHFYDRLCAEAHSGATAAIDGGPSAHTAVISEGDGTVFLGPPASGPGRSPEGQYDGHPFPTPTLPPNIPACPVASYCPSPYTDGGAVGSRAKIEKHRFLWKEPNPDVLGGGTGWEPNKRRDYTEPGGSSPTGVPGVSRGDMWIREDFRGCYDGQIETASCSCPVGQNAYGWKVYWDYHSHDGRGRVLKGENCGCIDVVTEIPDDPNTPENEGGYDTDGDGVADSNEAPAETGFVDSIGGFSVTGTHTGGSISSISVTSTNNGGGDGDSGGDGGCFLTAAVVERRGEADDGPTLTALREFRDRYMMTSPERMAMVAEYYRRAPEIVAAIPQDHPEWDWIGARIDEAVAAIRAGDNEGAFRVYVGAMRALDERWGAD